MLYASYTISIQCFLKETLKTSTLFHYAGTHIHVYSSLDSTFRNVRNKFPEFSLNHFRLLQLKLIETFINNYNETIENIKR